jgi:hypothetical protein
MSSSPPALLPDRIEATIQALGLTAELEGVEPLARTWLQAAAPPPALPPVTRHRLMQGTILYELLGVQTWPERPTPAADGAALQAGRATFHHAWAGYLALLSCDPPTRAEMFAAEELPPDLALALHLALTGLLADELPLTRQALARLALPPGPAVPERERLLHLAFAGLVQVIRRAPGDLEAVLAATAAIDAPYCAACARGIDPGAPTSAALRATALELRGLVHLLAILRHTAGALQQGYIAEPWATWPQHNAAIRRIFGRHFFLLPLAELFCIGCRALLAGLPTHPDREA